MTTTAALSRRTALLTLASMPLAVAARRPESVPPEVLAARQRCSWVKRRG